MNLLSEFCQLVRFLKEQVRIQRPQFHAPCSRMMTGFDVPWTEIVNLFQLPTLIFCSFLDSAQKIVNKICFRKEKQGPSALSLFILVLSTRSTHDVACEFACAETIRAIAGGWKQFPVLSKTYSLMGHYNLSLSLMPKSCYQQTAQLLGNELLLVVWYNRLPQQQYDLLKTPLSFKRF